MTRARREIVDLDTTCYYHCICRCVRRAFLWGEDNLTGKNYEHRKHWVIDRLAQLADVFAIEIAAYAVMSNHYHLVLRINPHEADAWEEAEVIRRWSALFSKPLIVERFADGIATESEQSAARECIEIWRSRLKDMSWFMRALNEHLARKANEEDQCSGRFWEGRYKSQALLDDAAVLTAMSYVDLNPIRAGSANTPEQSEFTSIEQRIREVTIENSTDKPQLPLMAMTSKDTEHPQTLRYSLLDYFALVDWMGRAIRHDKRGAIPQNIPPILLRLGIEPTTYLEQMQGAKTSYFAASTALGCAKKLVRYAEERGKAYVRGWKQRQALYL